MTRPFAFILSVTLAAACAGRNEDRVEYATSSNTTSPVLIAISPDVEIVADATVPVFRVNNAYWLYRGERWYRSTELHQPRWIQVGTPPTALSAIGDPKQYVGTRADTRTAQERNQAAQRERMREAQCTACEPAEPRPAYPLPPHQVPPAPLDDQGTTDQVPQAPTEPSPPNQVPPEADDLGRPDPVRD